MDKGLTLSEIVQEKQQENSLVNQMLQHQEANECSYSKGYINQSVFGCRTCAPLGSYGFCLGCFLECHLEHDTFEVGVKRAFRCDCTHCTPPTEPRESNLQNTYDDNF